MVNSPPLAVDLLQRCGSSPCNRNVTYRGLILVLTFFCYASYHLSRKPISVVKSVLHRNCSNLIRPPKYANDTDNWCSWEPFEHDNYEQLLGSLDYVYLFSYAISMFISGHIAERMNLRTYLTLGMFGSGILTAAFGMGYYWQIHSLTYYLGVQVVGGFFQATGWPGVVACVGNWFGKGKRGFIMGVWNSHTSVGNILGSVIPGVFVDKQWGLSFIVPGIIIFCMGIIVWLFLVPSPEDVGCEDPDQVGNQKPQEKVVRTWEGLVNGNRNVESESAKLLENEDGVATEHATAPHHGAQAISFLSALRIPGVIEFSLCLFFAKLVSYTFLFWLPNYINHTGANYDPEQAADLSALFDVGGIVGGIVAGVVSDYTGARAATCLVMLTLAAPMMFIYEAYGNQNLTLYIVLLLLTGAIVNGPYALITTAVSADLGTHESLHGNAKALATVTAIIDGTGSMGAALGPLLTGLIVPTGWKNVFYMLIGADICALLFLIRLVVKEFKKSSCCRVDAILDDEPDLVGSRT
ncbi:glucose-6-phosphate exchanger SLC37A2-like [Lineus longissimus]|uniref:glucose-6-phosphate exchanger SLC37A2-like n=1 Tax=Lineus longissimus TaxID=88925 RepID=UPI002B4D9C94